MQKRHSPTRSASSPDRAHLLISRRGRAEPITAGGRPRANDGRPPRSGLAISLVCRSPAPITSTPNTGWTTPARCTDRRLCRRSNGLRCSAYRPIRGAVTEPTWMGVAATLGEIGSEGPRVARSPNLAWSSSGTGPAGTCCPLPRRSARAPVGPSPERGHDEHQCKNRIATSFIDGSFSRRCPGCGRRLSEQAPVNRNGPATRSRRCSSVAPPGCGTGLSTASPAVMATPPAQKRAGCGR
jgi:hypothetical protein